MSRNLFSLPSYYQNFFHPEPDNKENKEEKSAMISIGMSTGRFTNNIAKGKLIPKEKPKEDKPLLK